MPLPRTPKNSDLRIDPNPALDLGPGESDDDFILNPVLTLPPAFGSTYVGETFSCTLCANNEIQIDSERQVSSVKIGAEMQAPSGTIPLDLLPIDDLPAGRQLKPAQSLQKIVRFDLREEGSHTLAVNLTYSETTIIKDQSASGGRIRTFRKLYQFMARPCLNVRTKVSPCFLDDTANEATNFALEAQLDNMADSAVTLTRVFFNPKPAFTSTSFNWETVQSEGYLVESPLLAPRDVTQIAFLLQQQDNVEREMTRDGRAILGQLTIEWRTTMGDMGLLSTGWLTTKKR